MILRLFEKKNLCIFSVYKCNILKHYVLHCKVNATSKLLNVLCRVIFVFCKYLKSILFANVKYAAYYLTIASMYYIKCPELINLMPESLSL